MAQMLKQINKEAMYLWSEEDRAKRIIEINQIRRKAEEKTKRKLERRKRNLRRKEELSKISKREKAKINRKRRKKRGNGKVK